MCTGMWKERGMTAGQKDAERQRDARRRAEGYGLQDRQVPPGQCFWCRSTSALQRSRFPVGFLKFTSAPQSARKRGVLRRQGQAGVKAAITAPTVTWSCGSIYPATGQVNVRGRAGQSARHCVPTHWESLASARSHAHCLKTVGYIITPAVNPRIYVYVQEKVRSLLMAQGKVGCSNL